jgi:hypothetical protein
MIPGHDTPATVAAVYGRDHAHLVILASMADYAEKFGAG